jgi:hypothetical protein
MKKTILLPLFFVLAIISAYQACAIAFVPPIIYFASLSILSFISNIFLFLAVWFAIKGIANRSYFGRPVHEIVSLILNWSGTAVLILICSVIPLLVMHPIITKDIIISSICAGFLSFIMLFLSKYRQFRLIKKPDRIKYLRSVILISAAVIIITFVSTLISIETKAMYTNNQDIIVIKEEKNAIALPSFGFNKASESLARDSASKMDSAPMEAGALTNGGISAKATPSNELKALWFYPANSDVCSVYFEGKIVFEKKPEKNCYYLDAGGKKAIMQCPIELTVNDFNEKMYPVSKGNIIAAGSCTEKYNVTIEKTGFVVE